MARSVGSWKRLRVIAGLFGVLGAATLSTACKPAPTCTATWIGPAGGDFAAAANWDNAAVPGAGSRACAAPGSSIVVHTVAAVAAANLAGSIDLAPGGTLSIGGPDGSKISRLTLSGGTLAGNGHVAILDDLTWTAGTMAGDGVSLVRATATTAVTGTATLTDKRILVLHGDLTLPGTALVLCDDALFAVRGTLDVTVASTIASTGCGQVGHAAFVVPGTLVTDADLTATVPTVSWGAVHLRNGSTFAAGVYLQGLRTTATTDLDAGTTLRVANGDGTAVLGQGTLRGEGLIDGGLAGAPVIEPGDPAVPGSTGMLHVTGSYDPTSAANLVVDIKGTTPGTGYDQLGVGHTASINGALTATLAAGFTPAAGTTVDAVLATERTGTFASATVPAGTGLSWGMAYGNHGAGLSTQSAVTSSNIGAVPAGQAVTFDATIASSTEPPTGTVTFLDGATTLGTAPIDAKGHATFATAALSVGAHPITASYPGDPFHGATVTSVLDQSVVVATGTTPVITWSPPAAITFGTPLGAAQLSATTPVAGTFTYMPVSGTVLPGGPRVLSAVFTPTDAVTYGVATKTVPLTVDAAPTSTALRIGPNPVDVSKTIYLGATVAAPGTSEPVAGTVEFRDAGTLVGRVSVDGFGQAILGTKLAIGTHPITASFVATPNFGGSTSPGVDAVITDLCSQPAGPGVNWSGCDKQGIDLHGADLTGMLLYGTDLTGAKLAGADLSGAGVSGARLADADLAGADLTGSDLSGTELTGATLIGADLTGADLRSARFDDANLTGAKLASTQIEDTTFFHANLNHVTSGLMTGTPFALPASTRVIGGYVVGPGADLTGAHLAGLDLLDVSLAGATLTNAEVGAADLGAVSSLSFLTSGGLVGTPTSVPAGYVLRKGFIVGSNVNLIGADLRDTDLAGLAIDYADLTNADLSGADLTGSDLSFSRKTGTKFGTATLVDADLHIGDLTNASFAGADLTRARFGNQVVGGADLTGAFLTGVRSSQLSGTPAALPSPWKLLGGMLVGPGADLHDAILDDLDLTGANLTGANLTGASLRRTTIGGVPFAGATLDGVRSGELVGTPASLPAGWSIAGGPLDATLVGPGAFLLGKDFTGVDFSGLDLTGAAFDYAGLTNANFAGATLTRASFSHASVGGTNFTGVTFTGVRSGSMTGAPAALPLNWSLVAGYLVGPSADLTNADLTNANLAGVQLSGATLTGATMSGADLTGADLTSAQLTDAVLTGATLAGTKLSGATLTGVVSGSITGTPASLPAGWVLFGGTLFVPGPGVDLHGLDLTGIDLTGIDLTGANLAGATLTNATLTGATLTSATLTGVVTGGLTGVPAALPTGWSIMNGFLVGPGADLSGVDLTGANLSGADLTGANLTGADLTGADLTGAKLTNATIDGSTFAGVTLLGVSSGGLTGSPLSLPSPWQSIAGYLIGPGADLAGAQLATAHLGAADLHGANLAGADLLGVTALGANLSGVDFTGANLQGFDVRLSDLTNAKLAGVNVQFANFLASTLTGVTSGGITGTPFFLERATLVGGYLVGPGLNLAAQDLNGLDFTGLNLRGANLGNAKMGTTNLTNVWSGMVVGEPLTLPANWTFRTGFLLGPTANLAGQDLTGIFLTNIDLTNADLSGSTLTNTDVDATNFTGTTLTGVRSGGVTGVAAALPAGWSQAGFYLVGPGADLSSADLTGLDLTGADLTNANLTSAKLQGVALGGATLTGATLANITSGAITGTPLTLPTSWVIVGARLFGPEVDASGVDLTGVDLRNVQLSGANFASANLTNARLDAANLTGANLSGAVFTGATFGSVGAPATYVNLSRADLTNAPGPGGSTSQQAIYTFDTTCYNGAWATNFSSSCAFVGPGW